MVTTGAISTQEIPVGKLGGGPFLRPVVPIVCPLAKRKQLKKTVNFPGS